MIKSTAVATFWLLLTVSLWVHCDVDDSSIDLSIFKLRHVDGRQFSRQRADDPIDNLATGAQFMRESLYLNDFQVRCISYAHLLKLIQKQRPEERPIKQNVVQALAMVADVDRPIYLDLFSLHEYSFSRVLFVRAIEELEERIDSDNVALDTWHDLIECSSAYFYGLDGFLSEPRRAKILDEFEKFKALPRDVNEWEAEGRLRPHVGRVVRKYDGQEPRLLPFDERELNEARRLIESFDDPEMSLLRRKVEHDIRTGRRYNMDDDDERRSDDNTNHDDDDDLPSGDTNEAVKGIKVVITIPDDSQIEVSFDGKPSEEAGGRPKLDTDDSVRSRLLTMVFIKRRLSSRPDLYGATPKLTINSAIDFTTHWTDLSYARHHSRNEQLVQLLGEFLDDPTNQALEKRLEQVVANYKLLGEQLTLMELKRKKKKFASMEELEETYKKTFDILEQMDKAFDVYDIGRAVELKKRKELKEFETMNKFIGGDLYW